jgi:hypothetical protein
MPRMTNDKPSTLGDSARHGTLEKRSISTGERIPNSAIFLKRTALEFLQIVFSTRPQDSFKYDADDTISEIQIQDAFAADLKAMGGQPSIIATRGPVSWMGQGLGGSSIESRQMQTGDHMFNDVLIGSLTFNCMSREEVEADNLAMIVMNSFRYFRPQLQKYGFLTIKSVNLGGASLIDAAGIDDKLYAVPVILTAQIQERYSVSDQAPRELREIIIKGIQTVP